MQFLTRVFMIKEHSSFRLAWDIVVAVSVAASLVLIPMRTVFGLTLFSGHAAVLVAIDVLLWVDILLNFFTTYRLHGEEVLVLKRTARRYLVTWFLVDVIANIPMSYAVTGPTAAFLHVYPLFRLLRLARLFVVFRRWERLNWAMAGYLRIARFVLSLMIATHWIACAWYVTALAAGFPGDSWIARRGLEQADPFVQYVQSLYWTIITMTTVGYGDITPARTVEYVLAAAVALLGATAYAFMVGAVASLLSAMNASKQAYWNRVQTVHQYLRGRRLPEDLNRRLRDYYEYIWARYRGERERELFDDLPAPLRGDVLSHLAKDAVERAPIFRHCTPALQRVLLLALRPAIFPPLSPILREDELGSEMCFMIEGRARIVSARDGREHGVFEAGDHFGDLSMILHEHRTASVVAMTYCEVFILSKTEFDRIMEDYPEFRDVLARTSSEKTEKVTDLLMAGIVL